MIFENIKNFSVNNSINIILETLELNENSKNTPIIEILQKSKLCIFLLGSPGSGKSTFIKEKIQSLNNTFSIVSTDEISNIYNRSSGLNVLNHFKGSSKKTKKRIEALLESGVNFIYDTTGLNFDKVLPLYEESLKRGYTPIIIQLLVPRKVSMERVKLRNQVGTQSLVKTEYVDKYLNKTESIIKNYIKELKYINQDFKYYLVVNIADELSYYKIKDENTILKRTPEEGYSKPINMSLDSFIEILK